jgi:hypothetical protein
MLAASLCITSFVCEQAKSSILYSKRQGGGEPNWADHTILQAIQPEPDGFRNDQRCSRKLSHVLTLSLLTAWQVLRPPRQPGQQWICTRELSSLGAKDPVDKLTARHVNWPNRVVNLAGCATALGAMQCTLYRQNEPSTSSQQIETSYKSSELL